MRSQSRDPYPWTWEPAAAAICVLVLLGMIAAKAGTTLSAWILRRPTMDLVTTLNDLARAPMHEQAITLGAIIIAELVTLILAGWGTHRLSHTLGAIGPRGFATPAEAQQTLGTRRLHRHRRIIRPDLDHGPATKAIPPPSATGGKTSPTESETIYRGSVR